MKDNDTSQIKIHHPGKIPRWMESGTASFQWFLRLYAEVAPSQNNNKENAVRLLNNHT